MSGNKVHEINSNISIEINPKYKVKKTSDEKKEYQSPAAIYKIDIYYEFLKTIYFSYR